jgi:hypothetical protein
LRAGDGGDTFEAGGGIGTEGNQFMVLEIAA